MLELRKEKDPEMKQKQQKENEDKAFFSPSQHNHYIFSNEQNKAKEVAIYNPFTDNYSTVNTLEPNK